MLLFSLSLPVQGAVVSCYAGPLISLLHGTSPTHAQLQEMTASVTQDVSLLTPWELVNSLWGLAMFGAELSQQQTQALAAAAASQMQHMTAYQAIVATWALLLLCSSLKEVCSSCWVQLLGKLQSCSLQEIDEGSVLYLLHAAMQRAGLQETAAGMEVLKEFVAQQMLSACWLMLTRVGIHYLLVGFLPAGLFPCLTLQCMQGAVCVSTALLMTLC
jgi:hypothetical protein